MASATHLVSLTPLSTHGTDPTRRYTPVLTGGSLLAWLVGCALQLAQPALSPLPLYAGACVVGAAAILTAMVLARVIRGRTAPAMGHALLFGAFLLLGWGTTGWRAQVYAQQALDPGLEGADLVVQAVVAAMPQALSAGWRMVLDLEGASDAAGVPVTRVPQRVLLAWFGTLDAPVPAVQAGERWRFTVRLRAPHGQSNPHGFDTELWMWERGLQASGYVRSLAGLPGAERLDEGRWRHPVERARQRVRDRILAAAPDAARAGWVAALVTGDQNAISRADWELFRATGVAHLMSISGLHITVFAWLATALVGGAWRRSERLCLHWPAPQAAVVGGVLLATLYAVFSGWGVPAQRTVGMLLVVGLLRLAGRRWPWPRVWLLTCSVVVAWDPWALLQPGFWLSFVAVGVLFAALPRGAQQAMPWWRRGLQMLREQWVLSLALAPLGLLLFGHASLAGLVANLVAIPWVTLVVVPLAMLGVLWPPLWQGAVLAVDALAPLLQWLATWPGAQWFLPAAPGWMGVAAVAGGLLCVLRLPWTLRLAGPVLLLPMVLWTPPRPAPGHVELLAADVSQGTAVLVRTANHALLYDAGPAWGPDSDAGDRVLVPLLRALDARPALLVLSHRDTDHVGGAAAVLAAQPQASLLASLEPEHPVWQLRGGQACAAGQSWVWDGVRFEVLHPPAAGPARPVSRTNDLSCVLRIVAHQGTAALLAGDVEAAGEQALLASGRPLRSDYLLVPHHGSRTSSSAPFLAAVAPRVAVVQAGYRNRFGHPAAEPMARYARWGVAVAETARCGAATWTSAEPAVVRCHRSDAARYWHHHLP